MTNRFQVLEPTAHCMTFINCLKELKQMSPDFKQPRADAIEEYGTRVELSPSSKQVSPPENF